MYAMIENEYFSLVLNSKLNEGIKGGFIFLILGEINDELMEQMDNAIAGDDLGNMERIKFADVEGDSEEELIDHLKRHEKFVMGVVEKHYNVKMTRTPMQVLNKNKIHQLNQV